METACKFREAECYKCKKIGHIASACRTNQDKGKSQKGQAHFVGDSETGKESNKDEEEEEDTYTLFTVKNSTYEPMMVQVQVNTIPVDMEFDTGASFSLLNKTTYDRIAQEKPESLLQKSTIRLKTYTGEAVPILGSTKAHIKYGEKEEELVILVVDGDGPNLLVGRDWISTFNINCGEIHKFVVPQELDQMLDKHSGVFDDQLGTMKGDKVHLPVDPQVAPKFAKARTVPYALKENVRKALGELENKGVISPV